MKFSDSHVDDGQTKVLCQPCFWNFLHSLSSGEACEILLQWMNCAQWKWKRLGRMELEAT